MHQTILVYPVIIAEFNDDGHYFTVTSPNIQGMVTQGETLEEAKSESVDAIATLLDGEPYPEPEDPSGWKLAANESLVYITVDMAQWYHDKEKARHAGHE